jgi:protein TonB
MFEKTLLESSPDRKAVLTSRHRIVAMLTGLAGFLTTWKLFPLFLFAVSAKTALVDSLLLGAGVALHALMACYVFAEARRLGLGRFRWLVATLFTSVAGFIVFLVQSARRTGDWKRVTVPLASLFEVLLLGVLVLVPLIRTQALDLKGLRDETFYLPAPPPPRIVSVVHERGTPPPHVIEEGRITAPTEIPDKIAQIVEGPPGPTGPDIGVIGSFTSGDGMPDGVLNSILTTLTKAGPPPPVPAQSKPRPVVRKMVGGDVQAARLIHGPKPEYPPLARMARIQGTVRLEAIISADGRIQNLQVLSGHPLLLKAALDAVAQWRYQPTLLNGEPVEVETEVDVNFVLGD